LMTDANPVVRNMNKSNYFILTGAMGGGKSTLMRELSQAGIRCVAEPAREILAEQRAIGTELTPEHFCQRMLARAIQKYNEGMSTAEALVFDRGVPDMIGYAELFTFDPTSFYQAAEMYRYNPSVFFFAGWEEIYTTDAERKMSFEEARRFGENVRAIYQELGYQIVNVPFEPVEVRASFILERLFDWEKKNIL
jgi:predicted ATPase